MNRYEQTARLANELAAEMERGMGTPDQGWLFGQWLRRRNYWPGARHGLPEYDRTLETQARYAIEHCTPEDLRRQARELVEATKGMER